MIFVNPEPTSPGRLARLACLMEATARKPGNVHPGAAFDDLAYLDFVRSADVIAAPLDRARDVGVGAAVLDAVRATRKVVATNTNLGMILLLAPLAAVPDGVDVRDGVRDVLDLLTVDDARLAYQGIRLACPGGLGSVPEHDVADEPTITLLSAMSLAAARDAVARQYATAYEDVFLLGLPALSTALRREGLPTEAAIIRAYLTLMAHRPDTLIARKRGESVALDAARRAALILEKQWPRTPESITALREFDAWLRADGHARNPGATADLIAATLYVALRDHIIEVGNHLIRSVWDASRFV